MSLITPTDLKTHVYAEVIAEITRNDDSITTEAIQAAESEAMLYLSRYDVLQLFGTESTPPANPDPLLQRLVKDIAVWHIIRLSAAGIDQAVHRTAYQDAIKLLTEIGEGRVSPYGWPYTNTTSVVQLPDGDAISWNSNPKRHNHY